MDGLVKHVSNIAINVTVCTIGVSLVQLSERAQTRDVQTKLKETG